MQYLVWKLLSALLGVEIATRIIQWTPVAVALLGCAHQSWAWSVPCWHIVRQPSHFQHPSYSECGNCDLSTNLQICGGNFSPVYHFNISNMHPGYPHSIQGSRQIGPRKIGQLGPAAQFALNPESLQYPQQVQSKPRISPAQARKWWNRAMTIRRVSSARRKSSHNISLQSPSARSLHSIYCIFDCNSFPLIIKTPSMSVACCATHFTRLMHSSILCVSVLISSPA